MFLETMRDIGFFLEKYFAEKNAVPSQHTVSLTAVKSRQTDEIIEHNYHKSIYQSLDQS